LRRNEKIYAVLTGDLVKSSRLATADSLQAMADLKASAADFSAHYPKSVAGRIDTFRHDSWQLLIEQPARAFRAAVFLRSALRLKSDAAIKYDTRISIGIGTVEWISMRKISDSRGAAFTRSGKGLDAMRGQCFALDAGAESADFLKHLAVTAVPLLDCIVGDWTPAESRAVYGTLCGLTQEEIARQWPPVGKPGRTPSRQAVSDALRRAHWRTVDDVLAWIENEIKSVYKLVSTI